MSKLFKKIALYTMTLISLFGPVIVWNTGKYETAAENVALFSIFIVSSSLGFLLINAEDEED